VAGIPGEVEFTTKPRQAQAMLALGGLRVLIRLRCRQRLRLGFRVSRVHCLVIPRDVHQALAVDVRVLLLPQRRQPGP
jgi:hypothetical protein